MDTLPSYAHNDDSHYIIIPLTQGYNTVVDDVDADLAQLHWQITRGRYAMRRGPRTKSIGDSKRDAVLIHRVILERKLGRPLMPNMQADHINGNGLDNRRSNLREVTVAQNARNRKPKNGLEPFLEEDIVDADIRAITSKRALPSPTNNDLSLDAPFVTIALNLGKFALVDWLDADLANVKWFLNAGRYARRRTEERGKSKHHSMHRIVLERKLGRPIKEGMRVDHINGNGLDNRRENLREATQSQNIQNTRLRQNNSYQYKGVGRVGHHTWEAEINGRVIGYFDSVLDASFAYDKAALEEYGEFANLNHLLEEILAWNLPTRQFGRKNTSGYHGVQAQGTRWLASIHYKRFHHYLGSFQTAEEASYAYDKEALRLFGKKATLNHTVEKIEAWVSPTRVLRKTNTSGYRGVRKMGKQRWYAQINARGQYARLGTFDTPEEAARAYDRAALKAYGEAAYLNFPREEYGNL